MKRGGDLLLVLLSAPFWVPALLVVALLVRLRLGRPVLFLQQRPGRHGRPFRLVKFRTMTDARAIDGQLLADGDRLTRFGRWLRATSLDELPEIWNVLAGEMGVVGPRPLLVEYLPLFNSNQARRMTVRPGITGWAQVNGRNRLSWPERLALDTWYVDHASLWLDLTILARTIPTVLRHDNISHPGEATMTRFQGTHRD